LTFFLARLGRGAGELLGLDLVHDVVDAGEGRTRHQLLVRRLADAVEQRQRRLDALVDDLEVLVRLRDVRQVDELAAVAPELLVDLFLGGVASTAVHHSSG
jgi:hypothetical protein